VCSPQRRADGFVAQQFPTTRKKHRLRSNIDVIIKLQEVKNCNSISSLKYYVYVIELSKRVFTENARFRAANPQFNGVLECLYVGMTSKTPAQRFQQHKTGYRNTK